MALGRSRVVDGGDMLVRGLFLPGDEVVIDFTVFGERTVLRVDASLDTATGNQARRLSLAEVENRKVGLYKRMYDSIKVSVLGLAINLAGEVGPSLLRVIRRCSVIAGGRMPVWANWTAATFVGAWVQRLVAAVQVSNAQCVLSALSRVGAGVAALSSSLPVYS